MTDPTLDSSDRRTVVFVTGASGFVGRRLVPLLASDPQCKVRALVRRPPNRPDPKVEWIVGDLRYPSTYGAHLAGVEQVLHLGAAVGRCPHAEYFAVNDRGTADLVQSARNAGVRRLLYVSSIAVRFGNLNVYPYAASKLRGEQHVRESGMSFQIVRPTIVLGHDGPSWQALAKLARLPVTPVFGSGQTRAQPIDADDLAQCLAELVRMPSDEPVLELGGPEVVTIEELLERIHRRLSDRPFRRWHWPLPMVTAAAGILEAILGHRAPLTRGQLSVFAYDSTAEASRFADERRASLCSIDAMIDRAASGRPPDEGDRERDSSLSFRGVNDHDGDDHDEGSSTDGGVDPALTTECRHLHRYLFGSEPEERVWRSYRRAHQLGTIDESSSGRWDRGILHVVRRIPALIGPIDSYCRILAPAALLRRKLVLLLAIAEWEPSLGANVQLDRPAPRSLVAMRIAWRLAVAAVCTLLAAVVLSPWKWLASHRTSSRRLAGD